MAEHFTLASQRHTDELVGGSELREVVEVSAHTIPHGVYFVYRVPLAIYTAEEVARHGNLLAEALETIRRHPHVYGMAYGQDVSASGQLVDVIQVYYRTPSGKSHGRISAPLGSIHVSTIDTDIDNSVRKLEAIEKL